jgi:hypothetical protein
LDGLKRKFLELRNRFFGLLSIENFSILENPERELKIVKNLIEEKDAPISVSAIKHADYLLTLDKGFFKEGVINFAKSHKLIILPPKEFIRFLKNK